MDYTAKSEADIAYQILAQAGEGRHYRDLILEVIDKKRKPVQSEARAISEVYTIINMDSRFHHIGGGIWGLTEWNPQETKRPHASGGSISSPSSRPSARRREKLLEGIQEEEMPVKDDDGE